MDLLANLRTKRSVRKALGMLPEGIDSTYAEAWGRICAQNPEQAELGKKVLSWVVCALRPIRVREVQYAIAVEEGDSALDPEGLLDIGTLTSFCAGLVILDEQSNLLSLVHQTANEYFTAKKLQLFPEAHDMIAVMCCTYLLMDTFKDNGPSLEPDHFVQRCREHPLFGYAVVNWGHHVQAAKSRGSLDVALRLLQDDLARSTAFQALTLNTVGDCDFVTEWPEPPNSEGEVEFEAKTEFDCSLNPVGALHLAAYFGLLELTDTLIEAKSEIDQHDGMGGTAVHWALIGRQNLFLRKLLELGADANVCKTPAITRRWPGVARFSLPLHIAAYMDNTEAVERLLQQGAGINQDGPWHSYRISALTAAVVGNAHAAANLLLDHGADVNIDSQGLGMIARTALWRIENFDLLKRMTHAGPNKRNLQLAMTAAASSRSYDTLAFLLASGANVNGGTTVGSPDTQVESGVSTGTLERTGLEGETEDHPAEAEEPIAAALVEAISANGEDIEEENVLKCLLLLIDAGADVNAISSSDWGWYGPEWTVDLTGRELTSKSNTGGITPLLKAVYFLKHEVVRILVMKGADINFIHRVGDKQLTALSIALDRESYDDYTMADSIKISSSLLVREMLQLLIELGADTNLCTPKHKKRIAQLLSMSPEDCEAMMALQNAALQHNVHYSVPINEMLPFREKREKLKDLVDGGADIELCCDRDKEWIKDILRWTDEELDAKDRELAEVQDAEKASMFTFYNGPLAIRRTNTGGL
jgi:ankyrin repeat protein